MVDEMQSHSCAADPDVIVIAGGGPVGLALANILGARGHRVLLLERNADVCTHPRAIACDPEGLRALGRLGLGEAALALIEQDLRVDYVNGRGDLLMEMDRQSRTFGFAPVNTFYQPDIERLLLTGLQRYPSVETRFQHEIVGLDIGDEGASVMIRSPDGLTQMTARFVIGADGGQSFVRQAAGIAFNGSTFRQRWLVMDLLDAPLDWRHVRFYCDPARPCVSVRAPGGRHRFEFLIKTNESAEALMGSDSVRDLLAQRGYPADPAIERQTIYTFHFRIAAAFRRGPVLLAGDAAHIMPPFAGQGLMSGLRDAMNLGWKLNAVLTGADAALLNTYETERRDHVIQMSRLAVFLGGLIMPTSRWRAALRDFGFACTNHAPILSGIVAKMRVLPEPRLRRIGLGRRRRTRLCGRMIIQPVVRLPSGATAAFDSLLPAGRFYGVGFDIDPRTLLDPVAVARLERLGVAWILVRSAGIARTQGPLVEVLDESGAFARWRTAGERAVIVRPDLFIADVVRRNEQGARLDWLDRLIPADAAPLSRNRESPHG